MTICFTIVLQLINEKHIAMPTIKAIVLKHQIKTAKTVNIKYEDFVLQ
jgi:hypothetical protein